MFAALGCATVPGIRYRVAIRDETSRPPSAPSDAELMPIFLQLTSPSAWRFHRPPSMRFSRIASARLLFFPIDQNGLILRIIQYLIQSWTDRLSLFTNMDLSAIVRWLLQHSTNRVTLS
jgi:hypothetical protein